MIGNFAAVEYASETGEILSHPTPDLFPYAQHVHRNSPDFTILVIKQTESQVPMPKRPPPPPPWNKDISFYTYKSV